MRALRGVVGCTAKVPLVSEGAQEQPRALTASRCSYRDKASDHTKVSDDTKLSDDAKVNGINDYRTIMRGDSHLV